MEWEDDQADTSEAMQPYRVDDIEFYVADADVGWAELVVRLGDFVTSFYGFSLAYTSLDDIQTFAEEVAAQRRSRLLLRGEPGGAEILVTPDPCDNWLQVRIWLINYANVRTLDLEFFCPTSALITSLRTKTGFLARQDAARAAADAPRRSLWTRMLDRVSKWGRRLP